MIEAETLYFIQTEQVEHSQPSLQSTDLFPSRCSVSQRLIDLQGEDCNKALSD